MEKTTDFSVISGQISKAFRPGVKTNLTLSAEVLRREAALGTLCSKSVGDNLFIFRDMGSYFRMYYCISGNDLPTLFEKPVVTEIAYRKKNTSEAEIIAESLKNAGFFQLFERDRYTREPGSASGGNLVSTAKPEDVFDILRLMSECFHPMAGCIPTAAELAEIISSGHILCTRGDTGSVSGILHFEPGKASSELRHLAVYPAYRRQSLALQLFAAYMEKTGGQKSRVWVRTGNTAAEKFYMKNGYERDGYRSVVLISGKEPQHG